MEARPAQECPVVIAGGGLIGLSTAMFLAQQGIASLAVERLRGGSPLPRAAHFHMRTLELFRLAGIEDEVKRRSEEDFLPEGAIIAMDNLSGRSSPTSSAASTPASRRSARAAGCSSVSRASSRFYADVPRRPARNCWKDTRSRRLHRMTMASRSR